MSGSIFIIEQDNRALKYRRSGYGGTQKLTEQAASALEKNDYQWALELSDHLKWLDDGDRQPARKVKIEALRGLGAREYNAPNRNYYLSYANGLESGRLSEVWF